MSGILLEAGPFERGFTVHRSVEGIGFWSFFCWICIPNIFPKNLPTRPFTLKLQMTFWINCWTMRDQQSPKNWIPSNSPKKDTRLARKSFLSPVIYNWCFSLLFYNWYLLYYLKWISSGQRLSLYVNYILLTLWFFSLQFMEKQVYTMVTSMV